MPRYPIKTNDFAMLLHEARCLQGLTMRHLAEKTGKLITKQSISRYELGIMLPKDKALSALASALGISKGFLLGEGIRINKKMLVSSAQTPLPEESISKLSADISFLAERYYKDESYAALRQTSSLPRYTIQSWDAASAIEAADALRHHWRCGITPIASVVRLMERHGVKVFCIPLPDGNDVLSTLTEDRTPVILLQTSSFNDDMKLRFLILKAFANILFPESPIDCNQAAKNSFHDVFALSFLLCKDAMHEELQCDRPLIQEDMQAISEEYKLSIPHVEFISGVYGLKVHRPFICQEDKEIYTPAHSVEKPCREKRICAYKQSISSQSH